MIFKHELHTLYGTHYVPWGNRSDGISKCSLFAHRFLSDLSASVHRTNKQRAFKCNKPITVVLFASDWPVRVYSGFVCSALPCVNIKGAFQTFLLHIFWPGLHVKTQRFELYCRETCQRSHCTAVKGHCSLSFPCSLFPFIQFIHCVWDGFDIE